MCGRETKSGRVCVRVCACVCMCVCVFIAGKSCRRGRLSTVDLLELTNINQLLFILKIFSMLYAKQAALLRR
jgi:hypothetical protein